MFTQAGGAPRNCRRSVRRHLEDGRTRHPASITSLDASEDQTNPLKETHHAVKHKQNFKEPQKGLNTSPQNASRTTKKACCLRNPPKPLALLAIGSFANARRQHHSPPCLPLPALDVLRRSLPTVVRRCPWPLVLKLPLTTA